MCAVYAVNVCVCVCLSDGVDLGGRRIIKKLESPLDCKGSNRSILKEINSECSLEGLEMMKVKLSYFGHLMGRADSFEKTLKLGKIEGDRRRG